MAEKRAISCGQGKEGSTAGLVKMNAVLPNKATIPLKTVR